MKPDKQSKKHFGKIFASVAAVALSFAMLASAVPQSITYAADTQNSVQYNSDASLVNVSADLSQYDDMAVAVLGEKAEISGFSTVETGNSGKNEVTTQGGSKCWLLNKNEGSAKGYLNMKLSPEFKSKNDGSVYTIEVEYYDAGNGYFRLLYDRKNYENKTGDIFYMHNGATWKTATFTVSDAAFNNGIDGKWDLQLSIFAPSCDTTTSPSSIAIRKVTVKKQTGVNPVYVTSTVDQGGNAFEWFSDEKIIHNEYENFSNEQKTVNVKHAFVNHYGLKVYEKDEKLTIAPGEKIKKDFDFSDLKRSDLYWYRITITDDAGKVHSVLKPFEIAILKTDPDGITNEYVFMAEHINRRAKTEEQRELAWKILRMGNNGGARGGAFDDWSYSYEVAKGVFKCQSDPSLAKQVYEKAGDFVVQVSGNSPRYGAYNDMPEGEEQLEDWRLYVRALVKACAPYFDKYEIWNEPNILSFNKKNIRGDGYMKMFDIAYEEIKAVKPDAIVFGPCITGPHVEMGYSYYDETLEAGLWKNADGISIHPYATYTIEKTPEVVAGVQSFVDKFEEKSGRKPKVYLTELGYSRADKAIYNDSRKLGVYNARSVLFYESRGLADLLVFHKFDDNGSVLVSHEDMFGHVSTGLETKYNTNYVPHESYVVMTGLNYVMAHTKQKEIMDIEDEDIYISKFSSEKFGSDIISMYSLDEPKNVTLKLNCDSVKVYDEFGNETVMYGVNNTYSFLAETAPKYIVGDFTESEVLKTNTVDFGAGKYSIAKNEAFTINIDTKNAGGSDVEIKAPEQMQILEIKDTESGKSVKIKNNCDIGDKVFIEAYVKQGDKVIAVGEYEAETIESVVPELDVSLKGSNDLSAWKGTVTIKNNSYESAATGKLIFTEPESFKGEVIDIGVIPSQKTGEVDFNLPKISRMGQQTVKYTVYLDNGASYDFADKVNFALSKYADTKPIIDGKIEENEWPTAAAMYADEQGQTKRLDGWTKDDVSAKAMCMWDEDNFYIACEVTDDVHCNLQQPNRNWNGDNLQFGVFYGEQAYLAIGQGGQSYHEISASLNSQTGDISVWRYKSQEDLIPAGNITQDTDCKIVRDEERKKTTYEIKIPWDKLLRPGDKPKEGEPLGFSYVINETDSGERQGWIEFAGGIAESKDTSLFSYMTLIK